MIDDIKEIIGIIFMVVVGIMILGTLATSLANEIVSQFTSLAIVLLVIAGLAGAFAIVYKWFK
jgi:hypothetical protein